MAMAPKASLSWIAIAPFALRLLMRKSNHSVFRFVCGAPLGGPLCQCLKKNGRNTQKGITCHTIVACLNTFTTNFTPFADGRRVKLFEGTLVLVVLGFELVGW
jgi:hypothetical protein